MAANPSRKCLSSPRLDHHPHRGGCGGLQRRREPAQATVDFFGVRVRQDELAAAGECEDANADEVRAARLGAPGGLHCAR